ncbi:MAG: CHAD domain-containing protein [Isosphaeraceae bacterium]
MPYQDPTKCPSDRKLPTPNAGDGSPQTLTLPRVKPGAPAGLALVTALESALLRIQATEECASQGDHEGIHRLRTAIRRLRSDLRVLRDLVDPNRVEALETELKWFAGLLGEVRDVDVLRRRLELALSSQGSAEIEAMSPLFGNLAARREQGLRDVRNALKGNRYRNLLASLQLAIEHPALKDEAHLPCRKALPPLARASWRRLKKSARELSPSDPDESFHEVRKRAKRARYNAEMIAAILGRTAARQARHFIRSVTRIQDILGEHQDAIIAAREVADALVLHPDDSAFIRAGRHLLEGQNAAAQGARDAFFHAWRELDQKKLRRWMKHSSKVKSR